MSFFSEGVPFPTEIHPFPSLFPHTPTFSEGTTPGRLSRSTSSQDSFPPRSPFYGTSSNVFLFSLFFFPGHAAPSDAFFEVYEILRATPSSLGPAPSTLPFFFFVVGVQCGPPPAPPSFPPTGTKKDFPSRDRRCLCLFPKGETFRSLPPFPWRQCLLPPLLFQEHAGSSLRSDAFAVFLIGGRLFEAGALCQPLLPPIEDAGQPSW